MAVSSVEAAIGIRRLLRYYIDMSSKLQKTKFIKGRFSGGEKWSRHASEEFRARGEFIFCPHGEAVYYKKSWHHTGDFFKRLTHLKENKDIRFKLCPVHEMLKNKQFEGEIVIRNIPQRVKKDLLNLIGGMNRRAMYRDVLDRVLEVRSGNQEIRITTSENQLAQKIVSKIKAAFRKNVQTTTMRARESDVVRFVVAFS